MDVWKGRSLRTWNVSCSRHNLHPPFRPLSLPCCDSSLDFNDQSPPPAPPVVPCGHYLVWLRFALVNPPPLRLLHSFLILSRAISNKSHIAPHPSLVLGMCFEASTKLTLCESSLNGSTETCLSRTHPVSTIPLNILVTSRRRYEYVCFRYAD